MQCSMTREREREKKKKKKSTYICSIHGNSSAGLPGCRCYIIDLSKLLNTHSIAAAHSNNNLSIVTIPVHVDPRQFRPLQRYTENYILYDCLLILCALPNSLKVVF